MMKSGHLTTFFLCLLLLHLTVLPLKAAESGWIKDVIEAQTLLELQQVLQEMERSFRQNVNAGNITFALQEQFLMGSGALMGRSMEITSPATRSDSKATLTTARLLQQNLTFLAELYQMNQNIIETYKEEKLDTMENPENFFNSRQWQEPLYLVSLSLYWMSWNRYYAAMVCKTESAKQKYLQQAVEDFSTSIIDLRNPELAQRGLFGRGLCYKELKAYDRALRDLKIVADQQEDHPLCVRAGIEMASIELLKGNVQKSVAAASKILAADQDEQIAPLMLAETRFLMARGLLIQGTAENEPRKKALKYSDALQILSRLAKEDPGFAGQIYTLLYEHAAGLTDYSFSDLGPLGTAAIADYFFDQKKYRTAIIYYQRLLKAPALSIKDRTDDYCFRLGFCHFQEKEWRQSILSFSTMLTQFPDSGHSARAATLVYAAADNLYRENDTAENYKQFIQAVRNYLKYVPVGENTREAHFALGKYYQDRGQLQKAVSHFSQVDSTSPNYLQAHYVILERAFKALMKSQLQGKTTAKTNVKRLQKDLQAFDTHLAAHETEKTVQLKSFVAVFKALLAIAASVDGHNSALTILNQFEQHFGSDSPYLYEAKILRLQCHLENFELQAAANEMTPLMNNNHLSTKEWDFLQAAGQLSLGKLEKYKTAGETQKALAMASIAAQIYDGLVHNAPANKLHRDQLTGLEMQLASLYFLKGDYVMSKKIYLSLLEKLPQSGDVLYQLGMVYEAEKDWDAALKTWQSICKGVTSGSPNWFEGQYHIAQILYDQGNHQKACNILKTVEVLYPATPNAAFEKSFFALKEKACAKK